MITINMALSLRCACSGLPWVVSEAHWLLFLLPRCEKHKAQREKFLYFFGSLELWLYLQPLSGLVALKKLWMRFTWGLCYRFTKHLWTFHTFHILYHAISKISC